jgi:superoxide dismutase, Fe-Mn family
MFKLPDLPYAYDALEPVVSAETMRLHHDKHHAKYFETTNKLLAQENIDLPSLEDVVALARRDGKSKLFNNAAQAWNHTFFWTCMSPDKPAPSSELASAIESAFGGPEALKTKFVEEGVNHFASGWVWLSATADGLRIDSTHDGDNLLAKRGVVPLIVCDLWEHAYYVDYRNDREGFLKAWFDALPNWDFASSQFLAAKGQGQPWRHPAPVKAEASA